MLDVANFPDAVAIAGVNAPKIEVRNLNFWYGDTHALKSINLEIFERQALAFIGPSGCGKSTLLKCLNRMHDDTRDAHHTGDILLDGRDIHDATIDPPLLRRRFGWVAQKPNPFPRSVYENVAYGLRIHGRIGSRAELDDRVEDCLRQASLWNEVKDRLKEPGTDLSGGQQQRLCIARALSTDPDILLMDEPCSAIDPIATQKVEELIMDLKTRFTVVIVTHNMEQARRIADRTGFFRLGEMLEIAPTERLFENPQTDYCRAYLAGAYG